MTNQELFNEYTENTANILSDLTNVDIIKYMLNDYVQFVRQYEIDKQQADIQDMSIVEYRHFVDEWSLESL